MQSNPRVPSAPFEFKHRLPLQIRFNDIDALGHVNNSEYFAYSDLGKFRYMEQVTGGMGMDDISALIVNVNCDFYAPTTIDEKIEILSGVESIGPKSIHIEQRVINSETREVKCIIRTVLAGWDRKTGKSAPINEEWVKAMENFEGRPLRKE